MFAINAEPTREEYVARVRKFFEIIGIDQDRKLSVREKCKIFVYKAKSEDV